MILPPAAAKVFLRDLFFDFASQNQKRGLSKGIIWRYTPILILELCKKVFFALRAKLKFETDVFFMILLRKIMKNSIYLAGHCPKK